MSHENKLTLAPIISEMKAVLQSKCAFGESKHLDKLNEKWGSGRGSITADKIYSFSTMKTYQRHLIAFIRDVKKKHRKVNSIAECEKYVAEWIEGRIGKYSPFTLKMELSAIAKLYGKSGRYYDVTIPKREREKITRSRCPAARDKNYSDDNNRELIALCKVSGLRRKEISRLRPEWLRKEKGHYYLYVKDGAKGGRPRKILLLETEPEVLKLAINRIRNTAHGQKVFSYVNSSLDIHGYRHQYAKAMYKTFKRPFAEFQFERMIFHGSKCVKIYTSANCHAAPNLAHEFYEIRDGKLQLKAGYKDLSSRLFLRGNGKDICLDRKAAVAVSELLGHSRYSVTAIYLTS